MQIGTGSMVITAHASTPYKTYNDLLQAAKSKPGAIGYGTIGSGSMAHLAMAYLGNTLKVDWTHIPYKGGGPLAADGVAGHVPVTMATYALWAPHFASGRLRPLAVTSPKRMQELPDVPTLQELGIEGFEAQAYWGLLGPAGIPPNIVNRMNAEVAKALKIPAVQERLVQMGVVVTASSPADFDRFIRKEIDKWGKVVKENNIKAGQ
jgi:tripartite-type tricarboxylate transporter receptor subunit TctC